MPVLRVNICEDYCDHSYLPKGKKWPVGTAWYCKKCQAVFMVVFKHQNETAGWYLVPGEHSITPNPEATQDVWDGWIDAVLSTWEDWGCPEFDRDLNENVRNSDYPTVSEVQVDDSN